jgi:Regulator of chromosome condensation (RCC1) repeat/Peptidase_C39 like family
MLIVGLMSTAVPTAARRTTASMALLQNTDMTHNSPAAISAMAISAGGMHTCALLTSGGVKCWGHNNNGQLGNNSNTDSHIPVDVSGLSSGVAAISAGGYHTCALLTSGGVKCWGSNGDGELGNNSTTDSWMPVDVVGIDGGTTCQVPFFWQGDPQWNKPLYAQSLGGCPGLTIASSGCALSSAAMVLQYYGASQTSGGEYMNPAGLNDCMDKKACNLDWVQAAACSNHKAYYSGYKPYPSSTSWASVLSSDIAPELSQNHPVILGMSQKATGNTHFVVVVSGQGNDPANYTIWNPAYQCGQNEKLTNWGYSTAWEPLQVVYYHGQQSQPVCNFPTTPPPTQCPTVTPVGVGSGLSMTPVNVGPIASLRPQDSTLISGTVQPYDATDITMTIELTAESSVSTVTQMLIWSDTYSNTIWQPFAPYVWLPIGSYVYARFQDGLGNVSDIISTATTPSAPLISLQPLQNYLPLMSRN